MRVLTIATLGSLPRARVLARSLRAHQPDWTHEVVLVASEEVVSAVAESDPVLRVRAAGSELDLDVEALLALHDEHELIALLAPALLAHSAKRASEPVLHLPSTIWVLADLRPIEAALSTNRILLTPRVSADMPKDGLEPSRLQLDRAGRMDETIIGVDGSTESRRFLEWWGDHAERALGSLDARQSGDRPEDRSWLARLLELAPARFDTGVLEDPGCNLSLWNLHQRTLHTSADRVSVNGRWPLRFLHLPGFEPDRPSRLAANASRARVSRSPALHELCERYAQDLLNAGWSDIDHHREVGRRLADDLVYDESLRAAYATALALGEPIEDLFDARCTRDFISWLGGPAPSGGAYGINRYLFHRVARERPDVVRSYQDLDGPEGAEFVAWCWTYGREELVIPDRFMPSPHGERAAAVTKAPERNRAQAAEAVQISTTTPRSEDDGLAVRLTGYLGHTLGLGAAARGYAQALGAAGVPVRTVSVPLHHLALPVELAEEYGRHVFEDMVHDDVHHDFEIVAVNAEELPELGGAARRGLLPGAEDRHLGLGDRHHPSALAACVRARTGDLGLLGLHGARTSAPWRRCPRSCCLRPCSLPPSRPRPSGWAWPRIGSCSCSSIDYLSTIQRKNPVGLIEAFKRAFRPGEGPQLLLKTINGPLRPLAEEEVLWAAHGRSDIHVIDRSLSGERLDGVMAGVRLLRFAAPVRGVRADDGRGDGDRQAGHRDWLLGEHRLHERGQQLPGRLHDRPGRSGLRDLPAGGRVGANRTSSMQRS